MGKRCKIIMTFSPVHQTWNLKQSVCLHIKLYLILTTNVIYFVGTKKGKNDGICEQRKFKYLSLPPARTKSLQIKIIR